MIPQNKIATIPDNLNKKKKKKKKDLIFGKSFYFFTFLMDKKA